MSEPTVPYAEWLRLKEHDGKWIYRTRKEAKRKANEAAQRYGEPRSCWNHYRCTFCGLWHIGHFQPQTKEVETDDQE